MKPPLRIKSVGTKVSAAEFAALEERAQSAGLTLSEWVREVLLSAPAEPGPEMGEVVLAELLALRTLFGFTPLGAEFMGIKQGEAKGIYGPGAAAIVGAKEQDAARWQTYLADAESTLIGLADAVRSGEIGQHPTTPRCPDKCEYWSLCRGNRFELNRRLRESKAGETIGAV